MSFPIIKKGKQGRWPGALALFISPLAIILALRWLFYEPFVIPSESMVPNLLVHDHILVSKYTYGIKPPFGDGWLVRYGRPQRGDIIVFRFPQNRDIFFVKRVIGLPGDQVSVQNGQVIVNGRPWILENVTQGAYADEADFTYFIENVAAENDEAEAVSRHQIRLYSSMNHVDPAEKVFEVPQHSYFVLGDNRDQSHDSRFWGMVDEKYIVGKASVIWLSCSATMASAPMLCDFLQLRAERIFKRVEAL